MNASRGGCCNRQVYASAFAALLASALLAGQAAYADYAESAEPKPSAIIQNTLTATEPCVLVRGSWEDGITVTVETVGLSFEARETKGGAFVVLGWPDASVSGQIGSPAIPVVRRLFVAPPDATVTVTARTRSAGAIGSEDYGSPLQVMSVQAPIPKLPGAIEAAPFDFDQGAYERDAGLPAERAVIEELGIVRGQRLFLLEVRPVAYNPVAQRVTVWGEITAEIRFAGALEPSLELNPLPGLHRIVLNPEVLPGDLPGGRGEGDYLIIVADEYASMITSFAVAKEAQGFTVTTYPVAPGTTNVQIKEYIESLWGGPASPDYVLLVGDTDTIPHWVGDGSDSPATDLPYVCMDGAGDWYPDIAIGRFPVRSPEQLQAIVDKTLYYENGSLSDPGYLKRAVFMAGNDNYQLTEGTHNSVITNQMDPNGYVSDKLYEVTYGATTEDVRNAFNDGRFFGTFSGHGGVYVWEDGPYFTQDDVNGLTNADMYSYVWSFACITGAYTVGECFVETWIRAANKGAVAITGSSVNSFWIQDDVLEKRLFDSIFDVDDDIVAEAGPVWNDTRMRYLAQMGVSQTTRRYFEMYNLMGDPSLPFPGMCSHAGVILLDRRKYACVSTAVIEVNDCDLNLDDGTIDSVEVTIESDSEPEGETITLYETNPAWAQFTGSIDLRTTDDNGVLLVAEGDTVRATYIDADDGEGGTNVSVTAIAVVDCTPPDISDVEVIDIEPRNAMVTFDTDEPTRGVVDYGLSCDSLTWTASSSGYVTSPMVWLGQLEEDTTYFFTVEAQDEAGNTATDDNDGLCYSFATPVVPDYFTELFDSEDNDLDYLSLLFIRRGTNDFYGGCAGEITALPTDPAGGTTLAFSPSMDDGYATVVLSDGATVSIYGTSYDRFYPGSNGYITFVHGDNTKTESLALHFSAIPRISALYDDLDPGAGGTVSWKQLADRAVVTWENVPEYWTGNSNTFQIEMYFDGTIVISYLSIAATDGVVGLSEGNGLDPGFVETDLSAMDYCAPWPPLAENGFASAVENVPLSITLVASDDGLPEPPVLAYVITSLPGDGSLSDPNGGAIDSVPCELVDNGNEVVYAPAADFSGSDSFQFKANDGGTPPHGGDSNIATTLIDVAPDCNENGIADHEDIANCEVEAWCDDCNTNGIPDGCDVATGTSVDCDGDSVPDECVPPNCDDGDACTEDWCEPGTGCVHGPVDCNDEDACTEDWCDSPTGCVHDYVVRPYGDVYPLPGGDDAVEGFDILCVLDQASSIDRPDCMNGDIYPCDGGDGAIEGFDILAILDAAVSAAQKWCDDPCPP